MQAPARRSALLFMGLFLLGLLPFTHAAEFEPSGTFSGRFSDHRFGVVDDGLLKLQSPYLSGDFRMQLDSHTYRVQLKNLELTRSGRKPLGAFELSLGFANEETEPRSAADSFEVSPFSALKDSSRANGPLYFFSVGTHW